MSLAYNRKLAALALALIVVAGSLFGVGRSVRAQAAAVRNLFQNGTGDGYGIAYDLGKRLEYAQNLMKIARAQDAPDDAVSAVSDARADLDWLTGSSDYAGLYAANEALSAAVYVLDTALTQAGADKSAWDRELGNFDSKQMTIAHESAYFNSAVSAFNTGVLGALPARTLAPLTGLRELEAFA
ncbi:MAG: hypothetical protein PHS97_06905 [Oscillospiraceae bacterium]|nr:hypothetical protein [Oscillospiraceae bacterium]